HEPTNGWLRGATSGARHACPLGPERPESSSAAARARVGLAHPHGARRTRRISAAGPHQIRTRIAPGRAAGVMVSDYEAGLRRRDGWNDLVEPRGSKVAASKSS